MLNSLGKHSLNCVVVGSCILFAASVGRAATVNIPIPNAGFETITKPGNPGVTATSLSWFSGGVGNGVQLSTCCGAQSNIITWSDTTTGNSGDLIDIPGWTGPGTTGIQSAPDP